MTGGPAQRTSDTNTTHRGGCGLVSAHNHPGVRGRSSGAASLLSSGAWAMSGLGSAVGLEVEGVLVALGVRDDGLLGLDRVVLEDHLGGRRT